MGRLTRMTVNLFLIVAITLQQSVAPALQQSFSFACAAPASGHGCSCCESQPAKPGETCCHLADSVASSSSKSGCCGRAQAEAEGADWDHSTPSGVIQRLVDARTAEAARSSEVSTCCADKADKASSPEPVVDTGCHCVHAPNAPTTPFAPVSRLSTSDISNLVTLCSASMVLADPKPQAPRGFVWVDCAPSQFLHFAQIHLCVWRL